MMSHDYQIPPSSDTICSSLPSALSSLPLFPQLFPHLCPELPTVDLVVFQGLETTAIMGIPPTTILALLPLDQSHPLLYLCWLPPSSISAPFMTSEPSHNTNAFIMRLLHLSCAQLSEVVDSRDNNATNSPLSHNIFLIDIFAACIPPGLTKTESSI